MESNELQMTSLSLQTLNYRKGTQKIRAINHKLRQEMLRLMHQRGSITVTEIYVKLRLEQSVASQHLGILRTAGYVNTQRDGKQIFYSVNYKILQEVNKTVEELVKIK